jgi:hypothetical protein
LLLEANFKPAALVDERGCRRDIRSNGWTARFNRACPFRKPVRQKKEVFFIGADSKVRNFTGTLRQLRFGPDVFADALVPQAGALPPDVLISQKLPSSHSRPPAASCRGDVAAMVIALPNGRVNRILRTPRQSSKTSTFAVLPDAPSESVQIRFIAKLKLLFKFDRS